MAAKKKSSPQATHADETQSVLLSFSLRSGDLSIVQGTAFRSNDWLQQMGKLLKLCSETCPTHRQGGHILFDLLLFNSSTSTFESMQERLQEEFAGWLRGDAHQKRLAKRQAYRVVLTWKPGQDEGSDQTDSMPANEDTSSPNDETVQTPDPETIVEMAEQWVNQYSAAVAALDEQFDRWIASLEGMRFPIESADAQISAIQHAVRRAGRELVYQNVPVALYLARPPRAKNARIYVTTLGEIPQRRLSESVILPRLTTRIIS